MKKYIYIIVIACLIILTAGAYKKYFHTKIHSAKLSSGKLESLVIALENAKKNIILSPDDPDVLLKSSDAYYRFISEVFSNHSMMLTEDTIPASSFKTMIEVFNRLGYDISDLESSKDKGDDYYFEAFQKKKASIKDRLIDEAIQYYRKAFQLMEPERLPAAGHYHSLGVLYYMKGHAYATEATKYILKAINMGYKDPWGLCFLGNIYYEIDSLENAVYYYKEALKILPDNPIIIFNLAWTFKEAGLLDDASIRFKRIVEILGAQETLTSTDISVILKARYALGHIAIERKKYADAVVEFKLVTQLEPMSEEGYYWLGKSYYLNNQKDEAKKAWGQLLKIDPAYKDTEKLYETL